MNVPILFCLACDKLMVHPDIELDYELLKEYALGDRTTEVDLLAHLSKEKQAILYNPQNQAEYLRLDDKIKEHIDRTLDLYSMAKSIDDPDWKEEILDRLSNLQRKAQRNLKR